MPPLKLDDVKSYIQNHIGEFHDAQLSKIKTLSLKKILAGKNPYLFKAKNINDIDDLIRDVLSAFLSSGEETRFGDFLERLAIFINEKVYGGKKASAPGIDLEFERDQIRYLVSIKSGPNWGNSQAIEKMVSNFQKAKRILQTSGSNKNAHIEFVNGCCYGRDNREFGTYSKYCGQKFWEFISGDPNLYEELIEPLEHSAKQRSDEFKREYEKTFCRLVSEFRAANLAKEDGTINWRKLVQFASKAVP